MKKIIAAHIEQTIVFDSEKEYEQYIKKLRCKFKIISEELTNDRKLKIRIKKQYNKNEM